MKFLLALLVIPLPWWIKKYIYKYVFHYEIGNSCKIGFSFVYPQKLIMHDGAIIGHLNRIYHIHLLEMGKNSIMSRGNIVTGHVKKDKSYNLRPLRRSELIIGDESSITIGHHLDCTDRIKIGNFTTLAGLNSQYMTHSINFKGGYQDCQPIKIGNYCFVGTNVVVLGNFILPDYSILAASSFSKESFSESYCLYGGVPAHKIKKVSAEWVYFKRNKGFIK